MKFTPYLNFNGNCKEAFEFYARVLGGKIETMMTHGESPIANEVPPAWHDRVLHASLLVNGEYLLASDSPPQHYEKPAGLYVSIHLTNSAEADRIFYAFAEGGTVTMPIEKTFWAERFGMVVDRFGTPWMINCELPVASSSAATSGSERAQAR
jgi:PhnB protein